MQKLVTVYMDNFAGQKGGVLGLPLYKQHGHLEECLPQFLNDGWRVVQISSFGSASRTGLVGGFLTVLLEKA